MLKYFITILIITSSVGVFGQKHYLGLVYGNDYLGGGSFSVESSKISFNTLGVNYQIQNKWQETSMYLSESFESVIYKNQRVGHLKTAFGLNYIFDGNVHPIVGISLNLKTLVINNDSENFKTFSFGGKINLGFGFKLSSKFIVDVLYNYQFGFTPLYQKKTSYKGSYKIGIENIQEQQLFLQIGIHYLIKTK